MVSKSSPIKRERDKKSALKWVRNNPDKRLVCNARTHAKVRGVPFDLKYRDVVIPPVCPVFGTPFIIGTPYAASIDRIIPELGYVKENIQVISRKANLMKQDANPEELRKFGNWAINLFTH